jgi:two-component system sensor histidine kinase PilS (NtrC family)
MELAVVGARPNYPQAGLLGATLFATALLAHVLAQRAQESEARAARRELDLANMAQVTDFIIQHLQTGVVVIAPDQQVRFLNGAAEDLLGLEGATVGLPLRRLSAELADRLAAWHRGTEGMPLLIRVGGGEVLPRPLGIGPGGRSGTLIFLDDMSRASHEMQQLKLASLGRLTASIAHEIRNPLAAISHAGELLRESQGLPAGERRLVDIVIDQARRVNTIIENVLRLGRKDRSRPTVIDLNRWLPQFLERFRESTGVETDAIALHLGADPLTCYFDEGHLDQILTNLCENGLRYAAGADAPRVEVRTGTLRKGLHYIDVEDRGSGVPPEALGHIFEPFFTTGTKGTGLGLYIARELAECNRAQLAYAPGEDRTSRFRLSFSAHDQAIGAL